jgi:hypothetical protein
MRILFLSLIQMKSIDDRGIYSDMVREFVKNGHFVDYFFPSDKKFSKKTSRYSLNSLTIKLNIQKTNFFLIKLISYFILDYKFSTFINLSKVSYDLLIITTPSIFQNSIVKTFKKKYSSSKVLLLLKDIFPNNSIDLELYKIKLLSFFLVGFFRRIEKKLYSLVDNIGCMTSLNVQYLTKYGPRFQKKLFLFPNLIEPYEIPFIKTRTDLCIPINKIIVIFIGNLGIPQDVRFINKLIETAPISFVFLFIAQGTEINKINLSFNNVIVIKENLSRYEIDQYLINSNFGLITLDIRFKVPNFPSKLLNYFNANLPVIAFTNEYNDLSELLIQNNLGLWNLSDKSKSYLSFLTNIEKKSFNSSRDFIFDNYNVTKFSNDYLFTKLKLNEKY